jgi:hypothetical protein
MAQRQQPIRVVVEKKPSGCWGALGLMLLIGLAIEYWYVSLGILALLLVIGAVARSQQKTERKLAEEKCATVPDDGIRGEARWRSPSPISG